MKNRKWIILGVMVIFFITGCKTKSGTLESITFKEYENLIENKETFVLEMMSTDCSHCQNLKPKLQKVVKEYGIKIKVINMAKLSIDDYKKFTSMVGTKGTPTIIFYKDGEEKSVATRIIGDVSKEKIVQKLKDNEVIE